MHNTSEALLSKDLPGENLQNENALQSTMRRGYVCMYLMYVPQKFHFILRGEQTST